MINTLNNIMMKFNWGTGIFLFYGAFVTAILFAVIKSTTYDHSLVIDNYYEEDLQYQKTYDKIQNSQSLSAPLVFHYANEKGVLDFRFPSNIGQPKGEIWLYCPNDKSSDKRLKIKTEERQMLIHTSNLKNGYWKVEVNWEADGKSFLDRFSFYNESSKLSMK